MGNRDCEKQPDIRYGKEKIKVLLSGACGRMGRVIENCIGTRKDLQVIAGIDLVCTPYGDFPIYESVDVFQGTADVMVDFSHPSQLDALLRYGIQTNTPIVIATTGYSAEQIQAIREASAQIPVFFTFNMSLGVNLLLDLSQKAAAVLGEQFDIEVIEKHHNQKIDAPSGTAIMIADALNQATGERYQYVYDRHSKRQKRTANEIGIHSVRGGTVVGEHEVLFAGRDETLSIRHTAMSRDIFAVGAVNAAAFLAGKPAGLYEMKDLIS